MVQLGEELNRLNWSKYESACYHALVKFGKMKASQVADRIDSQPAKVYKPLNSLQDRGYVKTRGENPKEYVAQNPRHVIEKEQEKFESESNDILESLEEAWEVQIERGPSSDESAWVLSGQAGMNTELKDVVENAEDSIIGLDTRLTWATSQTIEAIESALSRGVEISIVGTSHASDILSRIEEAGATTSVADNHSHSSYYVVDDEHVLMNIGTQDATISFKDEDVARIMVDDFYTYTHEEEPKQ